VGYDKTITSKSFYSKRATVKANDKITLLKTMCFGELFTPEEVARYLKVDKVTVYSWVKLKKIDCYVLTQGKRKTTVRFDIEQIERFIQSRESSDNNASVRSVR
jgi:excisionase family DNA binding protein